MSSSPPAHQPLVRLERVSKRYEIYARPIDRLKQTLWRGRRQFYREFWALHDLSLEVHRGEALGILGRNGSGKSTVLEIIAGTLTATTGRVEVHGRIAALLELGSGFNPEFTGRENVYLNGAILGLDRRAIDRRFASIAAFADIGPFINEPVKTYSSGMLVRLAFAVQAQLDPDLIIVDEALAVGDEKFQRKCYARLDELRQNGASVILVTHSTAAVERYCDRAMLLDQGRVHGIGSARQIVDQYHALLYADEAQYLRFLNQALPADVASSAPAGSGDEAARATPNDEREPRAGALIEQVWMRDESGRDCDLVESGEQVEVGCAIEVLSPVIQLQVGLRIRTLEGVEAHGTSTAYMPGMVQPAMPGRCMVRFTFPARLCAGTYFATVAIAEVGASAEMLYLDKRTDVLMFRVREHPLTATGIAHLQTRITCEGDAFQRSGPIASALPSASCRS